MELTICHLKNYSRPIIIKLKEISQFSTMVRGKKERLSGLINQIRRAAVSIPSNIAEGAARNSTKEFIQFLYIALGSASETETQLIIAKEIGYIEKVEEKLDEIERIRKMILGLIRHLKGKTNAK